VITTADRWTTVQAGDVRGGRYDAGVWVSATPDAPQHEFDAVVAALGLKGITEYEVEYDDRTGTETWLIDFPHQVDLMLHGLLEHSHT
jgi:hypothetical protein